MNIAIACLGINTVIMLYLTLWVPYQERFVTAPVSPSRGESFYSSAILHFSISSCRVISKRLNKPTKLDWEVYSPRMIPTMTAVGLLFFFAFGKGASSCSSECSCCFPWLTPLLPFFLPTVSGVHYSHLANLRPPHAIDSSYALRLLSLCHTLHSLLNSTVA